MGFKRHFDFYTAEEVWDEYRLMTAGTPCDQMGMTNERLAKTSLRWALSSPAASRHGSAVHTQEVFHGIGEGTVQNAGLSTAG